MQKFQEKIGYFFKNDDLLEEALTHPSLTRNVGCKNYQRLEFLGDKVLSLVISQYLFTKYDAENEGDLSKRHAYLVCGEVLADLALKIGLDEVILLSQGEEKSGGRGNKNNLENALEALIGAIYLDGDYDAAQNFVLNLWQDVLQGDFSVPKDPVSHLQEIVQMKLKTLPQYEIAQCGGLQHSPEFEARVVIQELGVDVKAQGMSKKEAQKKVATLAIKALS